MKIILMFFAIYSLCIAQGVVIDQQLQIVQNDQVMNGTFSIEVQVKGTNLTAANTLGSATIDILYDKTKLTYVNGTNWAFGMADGYFANAVNNITLVRIGITGMGVYPGAGQGYDLSDTWDPWVQLNFKIIDPSGTTNLTIDPRSNAMGLFENNGNDPQTNVITDQALSTPLVINNSPLPVELVSFSALAKDGNVTLNWKTVTEVNNYGFEVQRCQTSNVKSQTWEKAGFVNGNGNSNSPKNYSFKDSPSGDVQFQYRLKQIDFNGGYKFSNEVTVKLDTPSKYILHENYPNPFNPTTKISFELPVKSNVVLNVFNVLGEKVSTLVNKSMTAGIHVFDFNASNLSSGIYFYRIEADNFSQVKKMLLIK